MYYFLHLPPQTYRYNNPHPRPVLKKSPLLLRKIKARAEMTTRFTTACTIYYYYYYNYYEADNPLFMRSAPLYLFPSPKSVTMSEPVIRPLKISSSLRDWSSEKKDRHDPVVPDRK